MLKNNLLNFEAEKWKNLFIRDCGQIISLINDTKTDFEFVSRLYDYVIYFDKYTDLQVEAAEVIIRLLKGHNEIIKEYSENKDLKLQTFHLLWKAIKFDDIVVSEDFFVDIYYLFTALFNNNPTQTIDVESRIKQWKSGLDYDVVMLQKENKERIIKELVSDITSFSLEKRNSKYIFPENILEKDKFTLVEQWWNDFIFHLVMAIRDPNRLNRYLNNSLSSSLLSLLETASNKKIPFFITPYHLSLLNCKPNGYDDNAIRDYVIYSSDLIKHFGNIKAWEREDIIEENKPNAAGWILPDKSAVHRRYPEVAILIPYTLGRACGGMCAYCQRMYGFQKGSLNFNFETLKPKDNWYNNLRKCLNYFLEDSHLQDILITGGDALMSQNKTLNILLDEVYHMALRKRLLNYFRDEKFAEIKRVRLGTRLPVYLPYRITEDLIIILRNFKEKALKAGIEQFIIQTHFQSPLEITPDSVEAIKRLQSAGWVVTNQTVFTKSASRRGHVSKLRKILNEYGVICYYTFAVKGFDENKSLFVPLSRMEQEKREEKILGNINTQIDIELNKILQKPETVTINIKHLLHKENIPFLSTDRSIMNIPAIGKSFNFKLVGIDEFGRRIMAFKPDKNRNHSPLIKNINEIYIIERKSVASYLRDMRDLGEKISDYQSIWNYWDGKTENKFSFYEFPEQNFEITTRFNHLDM